MGGDYLIYFPNDAEEISLVKFIAKFQYLSVNNTKYFFQSSTYYYRKRIAKLVEKRYLRRTKLNLVLDEVGIEYCKLFNYTYTPLNRNKKYLPRLLYISDLGAFYHNSKTVSFTPSFTLKDKEMFTITARRFVGVLDINGFDYLTYHISAEHDHKYLMSVVYDIQKERKYKNIIILIDDINRVDLQNFSFGYNQVLVIEDTAENRNKLNYLNSINWSKVIQDYYKNKVFLAEYNFCDYTDYEDKYISLFYFFDTEKINRIKYFLRENKKKSADIICSKELESAIRKELPDANYIIVDLENYIDKERKVYD